MGKFCYGEPTNNAGAARLSQSNAFCEGLAYRASGTALGAPITDNPHISGSPDADAWDAGWNVGNDSTGTVSREDAGCCATATISL